MAIDCTRRHFFFGPLLAAAVPAAGFGSAASLRSLGYKSPNEKLNIAAIGAGGKASSDIDGCAMENIVALAKLKDAGAELVEYDMLTLIALDADGIKVSRRYQMRGTRDWVKLLSSQVALDWLRRYALGIPIEESQLFRR